MIACKMGFIPGVNVCQKLNTNIGHDTRKFGANHSINNESYNNRYGKDLIHII